jgi:RimJ/RimL family protein N-acetyltransferase
MSELHTVGLSNAIAIGSTSTVAPTGVPVRLRDGGTAYLRPLEPGETDAILAVFDQMSDNSRALRYLTGLARLPQQMLRMLADVDGHRHGAWIASVDGEPAGVARFVRLPGADGCAELAFEVVDRHHGRGLATALLDAITTVAAARGERSRSATQAPSNTPSRRLLARIGLETHLVDGLLEAQGPLRLLDTPVVDRAAIVRLACDGGSGRAEQTA